jgi:hypothetical protein
MKHMLFFRFFVIVILLCLALTGFAQQSISRIDREKIAEAIDADIARIPGGEWLYDNCELFERATKRRIQLQLGLEEEFSLSEGNEENILSTDTAVEMNISKSSVQQNEANVAISRKNPNLIVAGANDNAMFASNMPAYVTTNAGRAWRTYRLPKWTKNECQQYGDPMLVADDKGTIYYAFLLLSDNGDFSSTMISDLCVASSVDGKTWTLSPVVDRQDPELLLEDKEAIAVDNDPSSPYYGRLYVTWIRYTRPDGEWIGEHQIAWSDDKGLTWSEAQLLDFGLGKFSTIRVGTGGTVFISSTTNDEHAESLAHVMLVSRNGGQTFDEHPIADVINFYPNIDNRPSLKGFEGFRCFPYVAFDIEPGADGKNILDVVYGSLDDTSAYASEVEGGYASQYFVRSSDNGDTWSEPKLIGNTNGPTNDHFLPWVSYDPIRKVTYATMYSSEEDELNVKARVIRVDLATGNSIALDPLLFDPSLIGGSGNSFIGDYIGSDAYGGVYAAVWTQCRATSKTVGNVYAYVSSPNTSASVQAIAEASLEVSEAMPNPVSAGVHFAVQSSAPSQLRLFDQRGIQVISRAIAPSDGESISIDTRDLPAGIYRARFETGSRVIERSVVVLH